MRSNQAVTTEPVGGAPTRSGASGRGHHRSPAWLVVLAVMALFLTAVGCEPPVLPSAPAAPTAVPGDGSAHLSWTKPANGGSAIAGYIVTPYIGATAQPATIFDPTATRTVTGLTNGVDYTFTVAATNGVGTGPASSPSAPLRVGAPGAPGFVRVAGGRALATLAWWPPASNGSPITGYSITPYIGTVAQTPRTIIGVASQLIVTGLTDGVTYTFTIAATNAIGTGPAATTPAIEVGVPPAAPTSPAVVVGDGQATLSWIAPNDNGLPITGYRIRPYIAGVLQAELTFASPATTQTVTGLTNGTTYTFGIAAINEMGAGPDALVGPVTVGLVPSAPRYPAAVRGDGQATVTWVAANGNGSPITGYVITPYIGATAQPPQAFASPATTQTVTGLTNGTSYTFAVAAINAAGTGPSATTPAVHVHAPPVAIASGGYHSCKVTAEATVECTGDNSSGQLGDGTFTSNWATPVAVTGLTGVAAVAGGEAHTCALLTDGTVQCWGEGGSGQLGDGTSVSRLTPVPVVGLSGVQAISAGGYHTCAVLTDGTARCWGNNSSGQLGNGNSTPSGTPVSVTGLTGIVAIAAGGYNTCTLLSGGTVHCFGITSPTLTGATAVTIGWGHACALLGDTTVRCWGYNGDGELGDGTTTNRTDSVAVVGLTGVTAITAGGMHTCAVLSAGTARCWGRNDEGVLGDGTTTTRLTPVDVVGVSSIVALATGWSHSIALLNDGTIAHWGHSGT